MSLCSASELANRSSGHADDGAEQRTGQGVVAIVETLSRGGDEELVEAQAPKGALGDLACGHLDDLIDDAPRCVPPY